MADKYSRKTIVYKMSSSWPSSKFNMNNTARAILISLALRPLLNVNTENKIRGMAHEFWARIKGGGPGRMRCQMAAEFKHSQTHRATLKPFTSHSSRYTLARCMQALSMHTYTNKWTTQRVRSVACCPSF